MKSFEKFALESSYKGYSIANFLLNRIARPLANNSTIKILSILKPFIF